MKKRKAIAILNRELRDLESGKVVMDDIWLTHLRQTVKRLMGEDSDYYSLVRDFNPVVKASSMSSLNNPVKQIEDVVKTKRRNEVIALLKYCLSYVDRYGVSKAANKNVLSDLSNWQLIYFIVIPIITALFGSFLTGVDLSRRFFESSATYKSEPKANNQEENNNSEHVTDHVGVAEFNTVQ